MRRLGQRRDKTRFREVFGGPPVRAGGDRAEQGEVSFDGLRRSGVEPAAVGFGGLAGGVER
jgi:hypothetical protein